MREPGGSRKLCLASANGRLGVGQSGNFDPDRRVQSIATSAGASRAERLDAALSLAAGEYCAVLEPDDCLAEDALSQVARGASPA